MRAGSFDHESFGILIGRRLQIVAEVRRVWHKRIPYPPCFGLDHRKPPSGCRAANTLLLYTVFLARQLNYQPDAIALLWSMVRTIVSPIIVTEGNMFRISAFSSYTRGGVRFHSGSYPYHVGNHRHAAVEDAQTSTSLKYHSCFIIK